jgi:DNA-damage-inducible protein D
MTAIEKHDPFGFESATKDGDCTWEEDWLRDALGYADRRSFRRVIERAMKACIIAHVDTSSEFKRTTAGTYSLSRFACFLIAMNSDSRKPQVSSIQVHLARIANEVASHFEQSTAIARVLIRDEVSDGLKALAQTAKERGVTDFGKFMSAGYRGMYNMNLDELRRHKGIPPDEEPLDRMNPPELAANLFRITQTDEKMKIEIDMGQENAERTAHTVGQVVRRTMMDLSGAKPEDLEIASKNVRDAKKDMKGADRKFKQYDRKPRLNRLLDTIPDEPEPASDPGYTADPEEDEDT